MAIWSSWQRKPWPGVRIDPANPLSRDLIGAWIFNEGSGSVAYNLAPTNSGNNGVFSGGPTWTPGLFGPAVSMVSASSQQVNCDVMYGLNGATQATLICFGNRPSGVNWPAGRATGGTDPFGFNCFTNNSVYFAVGNNYPYCAAPTGDFSISLVYDYVNFTSWSSIAVYIDGAKTSLTTDSVGDPPVTALPTSSAAFRIGVQESTSRYADGRCDLVLLWANRALSQNDIRSVNVNPFQMFSQQQAYPFYGIVSSPATPTSYPLCLTDF